MDGIDYSNLPAGTVIEVTVDGVLRTGEIRNAEGVYDLAPGEMPDWHKPQTLIPGYFIALWGGGFAAVKARNIKRIVQVVDVVRTIGQLEIEDRAP